MIFLRNWNSTGTIDFKSDDLSNRKKNAAFSPLRATKIEGDKRRRCHEIRHSLTARGEKR